MCAIFIQKFLIFQHQKDEYRQYVESKLLQYRAKKVQRKEYRNEDRELPVEIEVHGGSESDDDEAVFADLLTKGFVRNMENTLQLYALIPLDIRQLISDYHGSSLPVQERFQ